MNGEENIINAWIYGIIAYSIIALGTLVPVLKALLEKPKIELVGETFGSSTIFSKGAKQRLISHYSRIEKSLIDWTQKTKLYKRLHYYCLIWTIPIAILTPMLLQAIGENSYSKWFLTIMTTHAAILIALHEAFKVESNYKTYRVGGANFFDLYRRLLDYPKSLGETEEEQLYKYFSLVEDLKKNVRAQETENIPAASNRKGAEQQE
ncbi:MAG: DUF4231 domain-containing protein [Oscillospiraceae bacterium]|jgi:hypothetical protein|nr:DUF4231 domain-containing protein [Oscillospiraceae bacterium]